MHTHHSTVGCVLSSNGCWQIYIWQNYLATCTVCHGKEWLNPRVVFDCRSVMEDSADESRHVLTQGKTGKEDWIARGNSFLETRLFDLAAHCFKVAKDAVRFSVATAFARLTIVRSKQFSKQSALKPAQLSQELFRVSHAVRVVKECYSVFCMLAMTKVNSCCKAILQDVAPCLTVCADWAQTADSCLASELYHLHSQFGRAQKMGQQCS